MGKKLIEGEKRKHARKIRQHFLVFMANQMKEKLPGFFLLLFIS
jgi:hypothetical protein